MFSRIAVLALGIASSVAGSVINSENGNMPADSDVARNLMHHARRVQEDGEDYNYDDVDTDFLSGYSVKFQGCHHVQQWNEQAEDEEDVRIMTKRLVRFRLCPSNECVTDTTGCTSHYGDYVVDMETYMASYFEAMQQQNGGRKLDQNYDVEQYMECAEFDMRRHLQDNGYDYQYYGNEDIKYYVGPYCADQGGEIRLGLFTDDTCTSFAESQYAIQGFPYTESSMVSMSCINCGVYDGNGYEVSEFCGDIYEIAGKCESRMSVYYPNEAACSYIEGIKVIREDGVIRTSATKKSKAASVAIGCFLTIAVLLSGYVYYLRTSKFVKRRAKKASKS